MQREYDQPFEEINLTPDQWTQIPSSSGLCGYAGLADQDELRRRETYAEMRLLVHGMMTASLTPRQREVLDLYYLDGRTQVEVANILGISQPTVCQHLYGKLRGGRRVGGALSRLRKAIRKAATPGRKARKRHVEIIKAMTQILDAAPSRRRIQLIVESLSQSASVG